MSDQTPLQRAHALSAEASILLRPTQNPPQALKQALGNYTEAAELFERSASGVGDDDGAKKTLQLLTTQHRKLARDLERRIASHVNTSSTGSLPSERPTSGRRIVSESSPSSRRSGESSHGLGAAGSGRGGWSNPGIVSRASPSRSIPPFALRPPQASSSTSQAESSRNPYPSPTHVQPVTSPLHSSSSSSSAPEESYYHLGAPPDTMDPFSRFWGVLENMLEDISNPVAFATAPMDLPPVDETLEKVRKARKKDKESSKGKEKQSDRDWVKANADDFPPSPSESFYVVPERSKPDEVEDTGLRQGSPSAKTPEELALENESLKASLDALAVHAQALEKANKILTSQAEGREQMMKSVVVGMRREAQKAKQGQDLMRSQLLASTSSARSPSVTSPVRFPSGVVKIGSSSAQKFNDSEPIIAALRKRVKELEDELKVSKDDNVNIRAQLDKYKEKIAKYRSNTKLKRETRLADIATTTGSGSGKLDGEQKDIPRTRVEEDGVGVKT